MLLRRSGMRENIAEFVDYLLPEFIFEEIIIASCAQHSGLQDLVLLVKQFIEFESHLLRAIVCHDLLE